MTVKQEDIITLAKNAVWWNDRGVYKARLHKYEFGLLHKTWTGMTMRKVPDLISLEVKDYIAERVVFYVEGDDMNKDLFELYALIRSQLTREEEAKQAEHETEFEDFVTTRIRRAND